MFRSRNFALNVELWTLDVGRWTLNVRRRVALFLRSSKENGSLACGGNPRLPLSRRQVWSDAARRCINRLLSV